MLSIFPQKNYQKVLKDHLILTHQKALEDGHSMIYPEHLLLQLTMEPSVREFFKKAHKNPPSIFYDLKTMAESQTKQDFEQKTLFTEIPEISPELLCIFNLAQNHAEANKTEILPIHILSALLETEQQCSRMLEGYNITKNTLKPYLENVEKEENLKPKPTPDYCTDMVEEAKSAKFQITTRPEIIEALTKTLLKQRKSNAVLLGEAGVGKTNLVENLANLIATGEAHPALLKKRLFRLDIPQMLAGTRYRGEFEQRLTDFVNALKQEENAIVFIDEIHSVLNTTKSGNTQDAANILKPILAKGVFSCIGASTHDEWRMYVEKDKALVRRFEKITVSQTNIEETLKILETSKDSFESHHGLTINQDCLNYIVEQSQNCFLDKKFPDKAFDILDEACATARLNSQKSLKIENIKEYIRSKHQETENLDIALKNLKFLKNEILGQDHIFEKIIPSLQRSLLGFRLQSGPLYKALLVGPTGVGKTQTALTLSKILKRPLIRYDLSEYQEKQSLNRLLGAPVGYEGYEQGGQLVDDILKNPTSLILFDEVEKGHPDIQKALIHLLDTGLIKDSRERLGDFRNSIVFLSSNLGAKDSEKETIGFGGRNFYEDSIENQTDDFFLPEIRARLDEILIYKKLDEESLKTIIYKNLKDFSQIIFKNQKISISFHSDIIQFLYEKIKNKKDGARSVIKIIETEIGQKIVEDFLTKSLKPLERYRYKIEDNQLNLKELKNTKIPTSKTEKILS